MSQCAATSKKGTPTNAYRSLIAAPAYRRASDVGALEPTDQCRGEARSLRAILRHLKESGLKSGKAILAHCLNESAANTLKNMIETDLPGVDVKIGKNLGLCSFYAEKGGLLVGFEKL